MTVTANRVPDTTEAALTEGQVKLLAYLFDLAGSVYSRKCFQAGREISQLIGRGLNRDELEEHDAIEAWAEGLAELHARLAPAAVKAVRQVQEPFVSIAMAQERIDGEPFEPMVRGIFEAAGLADDFAPVPRT